MDWNPDNKFLNGPFEPWGEENAGFDLPVRGEVPEDLRGALFRISSNPRFEPRNTDRYHWWEGDGMVCAIYIRDGKAAYRTRWVETDSMRVEVEAGEAIYSGFVNGGSQGRLPDGAPRGKNVANTNVGIFDDHLLVLFEGGLPTAMHPETLETIGTYDFHGGVDTLCTAHYKVDPVTGDLLFFAAIGPTITWYRSDARTGTIVDTHTVDVGFPVLMHDFTVSEHYAIFFVAPNQFRLDLIAQGRPGVIWDESVLPNGTRILLIDRVTHAVHWFETGQMFAPSHFFNAHEDGDEVVVDVNRIPKLGNPSGSQGLATSDEWFPPSTHINSHEWFPPASPWRFRVNTRTGAVNGRMTSGVPGEFPKINDAFVMQDQRYGYFVTTRKLARETMSDGLAKYDYRRDTTTVVEGPDGLTSPSEPVFVQRRGATDEADGYLLSIWWDPDTRLSEVLIHDADDFGGAPLARIKLPVRVPFGFHGSWAEEELVERSRVALRAAD